MDKATEPPRPVHVRAGTIVLAGDLGVPKSARGLVIFAHGSGSSRHSPRNRFVAQALREQGLATLLLDLLSDDEEALDRETGELRFDIDLLAGRLAGATDWALGDARTGGLALGYFGASTGAAAALLAAASRPDVVRAVVSRGGRPDLAGHLLVHVRAAVLLIVGGADAVVLDLNRQALGQLQGEKELRVVAGAGHLFEEPGALETVASLAASWFNRHLAAV